MITADPTWGDIFEYCFKAQSSELERLFCHVSVKETFELQGLSFERAFKNVTPRGIVNLKRINDICTRIEHFFTVTAQRDPDVHLHFTTHCHPLTLTSR